MQRHSQQRHSQRLKQAFLVTIAFLTSLGLGGCSTKNICTCSLYKMVNVFARGGHTNCACQEEAKVPVGLMNRAQQSYYLENDQFSPTVPLLGLGIPEKTEHFQYSTRATAKAAFTYGIVHKDGYEYWFRGVSKVIKVPYRSYVGGVYRRQKANGEWVIGNVLCRSNEPGKGIPSEPVWVNSKLNCAEGTKLLEGSADE